MNNNIQIVEKPDWISWEDIKNCLFDAHIINREKGINMANYQWPAEKIKEHIGDNGIMYVALDGEKLVGTAALAEKKSYHWYSKGKCGYLCFACVIPTYSGLGIYHSLLKKREDFAKTRDYDVLYYDTHCKNSIILALGEKNGYRKVRFFLTKSKDHYNIVMAKWLKNCPYSKCYCWWKYSISKVKAMLKTLKTV